jgi:amino acid adenylation domain-containing protein
LLAEDAGVMVTLTEESVAPRLPAAVFENGRVVRLDTDWPKIARRSPALLKPAGVAGVAGNAAYITYTSGSTGKPKGVVITHGSAVDFTLGLIASLRLDATDRVLQLSALSFDLTIEEIFPVLAVGGQVVLRDPAELATTHGLLRALAEEAVTTVELPTAYWHDWVFELQRSGERLPASLRRLLTGTERVLPERVDTWRALGVPLVHVFGATEVTINSTLYVVAPAAGTASIGAPAGAQLPIGRPTGGHQAYVVDEGLREVPLGVTGELVLGGAGVARGYLGQPDVTASRFVPDPFGGRGERLYRMGDLARWLADGNLVFLGRRDRQLKIRGFRIELGEIEAALAALPGVRDTVVVARRYASGASDQRLVAYVVAEPGAATSPAELRARLAAILPPYMVPSYLVPLPALALLANGKVDRLALPAPEEVGTGGELGAAPRTPAEEVLAALWSDLLGIEQVGREDDFFARGGHSLLAMQLVSRVRTAFGVELPLRAVFEHPTVAGLAQEVEKVSRLGGASPLPLARIDRSADLPLSFAQQRLWFIDQLDGGSQYNMPIALRLSGELSVAVLSRVLAEVVRRHESLRTVFSRVEGQPRQVILPPAGLAAAVVDLTALPSALRELVAMDRVAEEARRPFDLARGPLLRVGLWRLGEMKHLMLLAMHHIVSDGWSLGVLIREVTALYTAFSLGLPSPFAELPVQYADFAAWQQGWLSGEVLDGEIAWWREYLAGAPPLLELPTDRLRPAVLSRKGGMVDLAFDPELSAALPRLAQQQAATLFMVLMAAFQSLLGRLAGAPEVCVGTPIAGRTRRETEDLIGFFVNTLVMRGDLSGDPVFAEYLVRVRREALAAYTHQELPFEKLVGELAPERSLSTTPIFQVLLALQNVPLGSVELPGVKLEPVGIESGVTRFDLEVSLSETSAGLTGDVRYDATLFDRTTIARLAGQLESLLRSAVASPQRRLSDLALLTAAESQQMLVEWRGLSGAAPEASVPALLSEQASRTPQAVAVVWGQERLSYGELDRRVGRLAHRLRGLGVRPETRVGLLVERSLDLVMGLLAIWHAGGAAVPLDPGQPRARLALLVEDALAGTAGRAALVAQHGLMDLLAELPLAEVPVAWVDAQMEDEAEPAVPAVPVGARDLAYLIYTSGTTGRPKAVMVEHGSLAHTLAAVQEVFGFTAQDRMPVLASASFDIFLFELLAPLLRGGTAVLFDLRPTLDLALLAEELRSSTLLHAVPAVMRQLTANMLSQGVECSHLRQVFVGGEAVGDELLESMRQAFPASQLTVLYGPTEGTILASSGTGGEARPGNGLGRPLPGVTVLVRDGLGSAVPIGVAGELWLGGPGVARGYLGRPELSAEQFVPDPEGAGRRLYRTGDRVRYGVDGNLEFLGRLDQQVKVRGYRIELGEIEVVLARHSGVREAAVLVREDEPGDQRLVAYLVPAAEPAPLPAELREALRQVLPKYMIPAAFVVLDALPLTPNGKLDSRALPAPVVTGGEQRALRTPVEEITAGLWAEMLGIAHIGPDDNFFELGGHSLIGTRLISRLRQTLGIGLPLRTLFEAPTVAALAAEIERLRRGSSRELRTITSFRQDRSSPPPLSFAQERYWTGRHLEARSVAMTIPMLLHLTGPLDRDCLRQAIAAVVDRHELLRTSFRESPEGPIQVIHSTVPVAFPEVDLARLGAAERMAEVRQFSILDAQTNFDYERPPFFRSTLFRCAAEEHILLFTIHHVAADWWSTSILMHEVSASYLAFRAGEPSPLPPLIVQFQDFARWQRSLSLEEAQASQVTFWREHLSGAAPVDFGAGRPRPRKWTFTAGSVEIEVPKELERQLDALSAQQGVTLFMTVLAAFKALLYSETGQDDLVVPCSFGNRNQLETESLIGNLATGLPLRTRLSGARTFRELLQRVRDVTLLAHDHPDIFWEPVVDGMSFLEEGDRGGFTTFRILFFLLKVPAEAPAPPPSPVSSSGLRITLLPVDTGKIRLDLSLRLTQGARLAGHFRYNHDVLDEERVLSLRDRFLRILAAVVADPECPMADLLLVDPVPQEPGTRELILSGDHEFQPEVKEAR